MSLPDRPRFDSLSRSARIKIFEMLFIASCKDLHEDDSVFGLLEFP